MHIFLQNETRRKGGINLLILCQTANARYDNSHVAADSLFPLWEETMVLAGEN
jgi:hypothetical protein